jgi:hypothetical protein
MIHTVQTQYRENYGAHNWDETGECPQYWKNKGGETYVLYPSVDVIEFEKAISYKNDYSEVFVIFTDEHEDQSTMPVEEEWHPFTHVHMENGLFHCSIDANNCGQMRDEITSKYKRWYLHSDSNITDHKVYYRMKNGDIVTGEKLSEWLEKNTDI